MQYLPQLLLIIALSYLMPSTLLISHIMHSSLVHPPLYLQCTIAQISPISIAGRQSLTADFQQPKLGEIVTSEADSAIAEGSNTPQGNPGAEPGTVKSFLKLFSGSGKAPLPSSSVTKSMPSKKDVSIVTPDVSSSVSGDADERPKSWRSSTGGEPTNGTKSVLSRYAHNTTSEKASIPQLRTEPKSMVTGQSTSSVGPSWLKQSIEVE